MVKCTVGMNIDKGYDYCKTCYRNMDKALTSKEKVKNLRCLQSFALFVVSIFAPDSEKLGMTSTK